LAVDNGPLLPIDPLTWAPRPRTDMSTATVASTPQLLNTTVAFIGGGNMASAIMGGLLRQGAAAANIVVVEPFAATRQRLERDYGVVTLAQAEARLSQAQLVVWAVKPQHFREACLQAGAHTRSALHLSVAAGIRSDSIVRWLGAQRVVRAMPNTPALVGKGITGLYARPAVSPADRDLVQQVVASTGEQVWVAAEANLDAVTALSGSGPAYVFYFMESMVQAGVALGLSAEQARQLAIGTFAGAAELARQSADPLELLRERVTSKGGTTYAALVSMESADIKEHFVRAIAAANARAAELGDEFGAE